MFAPLVVSLLAVFSAGKTKCGQYEAVYKGRCYEQEVLADDVYSVQGLVVDFHTNVLYFSNRTVLNKNYTSCYIDLNTKELGVVTQVVDGRAQAVDQVRHEVYIAGRDGIYKFYCNNKTAEVVKFLNNSRTISMFFKDQLYYCSEYDIYAVRDGQHHKVTDIEGYHTNVYMIDKDYYEFFHYRDGPSGKMMGSKEIDWYGKMDYYSITTDVNGVAYLCHFDKIYFLNKNKKKLQTIGTLPNWCDNLAFDKDNNVIYSAYERIIRLKLKSGN